MAKTKKLIAAILCAAAALLTAPAALATPQTVRAQYHVTLNGLPVGIMQETFEVRDGQYRIVRETHATGLLALVQRRPAVVSSSGEVHEAGLRPHSFEAARGTGDARRVRADFDWTARTLTLAHDNRSETVTLPSGTQDRLSTMYQFLFLAPEQLRNLQFAMTNGRKLDHYRYTLGPDTVIDTALGRLPVIHLVKQHAADETATEVWLGREQSMMPVKLRIIEDDGKRYEQVIMRLDLSPAAQP